MPEFRQLQGSRLAVTTNEFQVCKKQEACRKDQLWDKEKCECKCTRKVTCGRSFVWDKSACQCQLSQECKDKQAECPASQWDSTECKCWPTCPSNRPVCKATESWDKKTCSCGCSTGVCKNSHYFDKAVCKCVHRTECLAAAKTCDADSWDADNCTCKAKCRKGICSPYQSWDGSKCACVCKQKSKQCSKHTVWDPSYCNCTLNKACQKAKNTCALANKVFDDTSCTCLERVPPKPVCTKTADTCKADTVWNSDLCRCECTKAEKCLKGQFWDMASCKCRCSAVSNCAADSTWDQKQCKCILSEKCAAIKKACPADRWVQNQCKCLPACGQVTRCFFNQFWDKNNCACKCKRIRRCGRAFQWNTRLCRCLLRPECVTKQYQCPVGQWDAANCQCLPGCPNKGKCTSAQFLDNRSCVCRCRSQARCLSKISSWNESKCACEVRKECIEGEIRCKANPNSTWDKANCKCDLNQKCQAVKNSCPAAQWEQSDCSCLAACKINPRCTFKQFFNKKSCNCECRDKVKCPPRTQTWDNQQCSCVQKQECIEANLRCSPEKWDAENCTCLKACSSPIKCPYRKVWDNNRCYCKCENQAKCGQYQEWNNNQCKCNLNSKCSKLKAVCPADRWNASKCECLPACPNEEQQCNKYKQWNSKTCQCQCPFKQTCGKSQFWDQNQCRCKLTEECITKLSTCPRPQWDTVNCKCSEPCKKVQQCDTKRLFDVRTCSCICKQIAPCQAGFKWNPITCACAKMDQCLIKKQVCLTTSVNKDENKWDQANCKCIHTGHPVCQAEAKCPPYQYWEIQQCRCQKVKQCTIACPKGQRLHPDYQCSCVEETEVDKIVTERLLEKPVPDNLRCFERKCVDPRRFFWDPKSCMCLFRKRCPSVCSPVIPDTCECTTQPKLDEWLSAYNRKWENPQAKPVQAPAPTRVVKVQTWIKQSWNWLWSQKDSNNNS